MTAPNNRSAVYVGAQSEHGTAIAIGSCSAVRVVSCNIAPNQTMIERGDHDQANDGGRRVLPGSVDMTVEVVVELVTPGTAGSASTWQQRLLWQAAPLSVTEATSPARLLIAPRSGRLAYTHYTPITIYKVEANGRRVGAKDVTFAPPKLRSDAGGIIRATFSGRGRYIADVSATTGNVAGVYTYTIGTGASGVWTITIVDDLGNRTSSTVSVASSTASDCANEIQAEFTSSLVTVTDSGADLVFTAVTAGRALTITVTPAAGGAGSLVTTTAPVHYAERPSYSNDTGTVCTYIATTVSDSRGTLQTVGAWSLEVGGDVVARPAADGINGYAPPMPGPSSYAVFRWVHDVQDPTDLNLRTSFIAGTEITIGLGSSDSRWKLDLAQGVVTSQTDTDNGSARGYDETVMAHSTGSSTNHWQLTVY